MDLVSPIIDVVKTVGQPAWNYLKTQIHFKDKLAEFNINRDNLLQLRSIVRSRLDAQLKGRTIARDDVETWLKQADEEISRQDAAVEVRQSGCLSCFKRTRIVGKRTAELMKVCEDGGKYTQENYSLVVDDYSRILADDMVTFLGWKKKLQGKHEDIMATLNFQLCSTKIKKKQVENWLAEVEKMTGPVAVDVEDQVSSGNPSQYAFLATLLRGKIEKMKELYNEGRLFPEALVIDDPSTSALEIPTTKLEGSDAVKEEVLQCLMGNEVTKLGVWGMGGVGKTTIMEHVHNQLLKGSKFKKVIFVTVSQTFDVYQIQQQIADGLKEKFPKHRNTVTRAAMLLKMLGAHMPYVIILDDVWSHFDLKDVGIPEPFVDDGCKLVLTTRSDEVVRQMGCVETKVETLSAEASLNLFLAEVGDVAMPKHGYIRETLEQIVCECGGLPLAIKTVAGSMKGISDPRLWRTALSQLKQGRRNVAGTEGDKFCILKFSYDRLEDEKFRQCFLHCAMYPEDSKIREEELIEYWIEEEVIEMMETRAATKDEGYLILRKLVDNCLLESIKSGWKSCVRMHDLVRDMAIHISRSANPPFLVKARVQLTEIAEEDAWKEGSLKVSLMWNKEEVPLNMPSPKSHMLTTLLLPGQMFSTLPEAFFEHMHELKVLDLSGNHRLRSLPSSVLKLVKLTTLKLRSCGSLVKLPSLSGLRALKKLDLFGSGIEEIPEGLEMLVNLEYLDMSDYTWLFRGSGILCSEELPNLPKLQNLRMACMIQLKVEALGGLSKLETFFGHFSTVRDMSIFFKTRRKVLHRYTACIGSSTDGRLFDWGVDMNCISLDAIDICGEPNLLPSNVQALIIRSCNDVKKMNDVSGFEDVKRLQKCTIERCESMEYVFSWLDGNPEVESLELLDLENLKCLFEVELALGKKSATPLGSFSSLGKISIVGCPKIKKLLPATMHLHNLQSIEVRRCEQLEEILVVSSSSEVEAAGKVILPALRSLELFELPMLRRICSSGVALVCDSLERISIEGCPNLDTECLFHSGFNPLLTLKELILRRVGNLKSVFDEKTAESLSLWTHPSATSSFPLEVLRVQSCPQLKKIFSRLLLGYFQKIRNFDVEECDELEEIISSSPEEEEEEEEEESLKVVTLPMLTDLYFIDLPKLKRVCNNTTALLIGDSLEQLSIYDCNELKRIPLHLPKLDNGQLCPPASLEEIEVSTKESWESFNWDQPDAKNVLSPYCIYMEE